jgi:hypothetical protein
MSKTYVSFRVMSEAMSPAEITARLGLEPDHAWNKGDIRSGTKISEVENGWELTSRTTGEAQLQHEVARLLDRIAPVANTLKELSGSCTIQISCVVYAETPPPLNFSADLVSRIATTRAALDIDLYITQSE